MNHDEKEIKMQNDKKKRTVLFAVIAAAGLLFFFFIVLAAGGIFYFIGTQEEEPPTPQISWTENPGELPGMPPISPDGTPVPYQSIDVPAGTQPPAAPSSGFQKIYITDPHIQVDLAAIVVPSQWRQESQFRWDMTNPSQPQNFYVKIWNPMGSEKLELYTGNSYIDFLNSAQKQLHPAGSNYLGRTVKPFMDAQNALRSIVLPQYRPSSQILSVQNIPGRDGNELKALATLQTGGQGQTVQESVIVTVYKHTFGGNVNWEIPLIVIAGAAPQEEMEFANYIQTLAFNPAWEDARVKIADDLRAKKINSINQTAASVKQIVDARRQATSSVHNKWDQTIRGVENYSDPHTGRTVELDFKPKYTWLNSQGEAYQTDDPMLNPNSASGRSDWKPAARQN